MKRSLPPQPHSTPHSLANRLGRVVWGAAWWLLYRPSPRPMHGWRRMLLRLFGATLKGKPRPYPTARIWAPWNLEMHDMSCLGDYVDCYCVDRVVLQSHAVVSQYSFICTASHDHSQFELPVVTAPILIGRRAWVCADVFVAPGVDIGEGAVVAARSSVLQNIAPWTIAMGTPARPVKPRVVSAPEPDQQRAA